MAVCIQPCVGSDVFRYVTPKRAFPVYAGKTKGGTAAFSSLILSGTFFMIQEIGISCIIKTLREDATRAEPKVQLCAFDYFNLKGRKGQ